VPTELIRDIVGHVMIFPLPSDPETEVSYLMGGKVLDHVCIRVKRVGRHDSKAIAGLDSELTLVLGLVVFTNCSQEAGPLNSISRCTCGLVDSRGSGISTVFRHSVDSRHSIDTHSGRQ